ncbi:prenyltransferase/squalene oxidase repeat-containing protein [Lentzea sp. NPDC051213]|uniref:prenyltransferase/squalene oxidase repeat-containing protein n=1 Tax=Lentzea sp. NPDC051213 TaxID=3364126 RepID=UPI00378D3F13
MQKLMIAAVLGASLVTTAVPAQAGTAHKVDAAAGWLARQMADGERLETEFGGVKYPDQGLTIDAIFAFAAARTADDYSDRAVAWLAKPEIAGAYLGTDGESYAGAHAKLAVAARVKGKDPKSFGGTDLIAGLKALQAPSGRFSDRSQFGDFSNAFTQSYALFALGKDTKAATYLANSQCADGGFPVTFETTPCVSDVDATAIVIQALRAQGKPTSSAAAWLRSKQQADGGFPSAQGGSNANSTGLAAQVLSGTAAAKARGYLKSLQVGCTAPEADRGAIAYDGTSFNKANAPRATTQAVLGLTGANLVTLRSGGPAGAPQLTC